MNQKGFIGWIILGIIVVGLIFVYLQSASSIPTDILYPVKRVRESIYLAINDLNWESRFSANIELSNERVKEIVTLVEKGEKEQAIKDTLERLGVNQRNALEYALRIKDRGSFIAEFLERLESTLVEQQKTLSSLYYNIPHGLYDDLDQELTTTSDVLKQVRANKYPNYQISR